MSQRAGELCHRIKIQKFTKTYDEYNYPTEVWVDHVSLWARIEALSVKDLISAQAAQAVTVARCRIRWSDTAKQIDTTMRVIYDGEIYAIDGPPLRDSFGGKTYCTLMLSKGVEKTTS